MKYAILVAAVASLAIAAEQRTDRWIGLRYDDQRVIFYFAANNTLVTAPPLGSSLPSPVAKYRGSDGLHDLPVERLEKMKLEPNVRVRIGDRYELMLGGNRILQIEVERLVELPTCTDTFIGAIAVGQAGNLPRAKILCGSPEAGRASTRPCLSANRSQRSIRTFSRPISTAECRLT